MRLSALWESGVKPFPKSTIPHANLAFRGHYLSPDEIPSLSVVYVVHAASRNILFPNLLSVRRAIYIGQAGDGEARHQDHERAKDWPTHLLPGEILTFTWAYVPAHLRDQAEAALIFETQPAANVALKADYTQEPIFVHSRGAIGTLKPDIFASNFGAIMRRIEESRRIRVATRILGLTSFRL